MITKDRDYLFLGAAILSSFIAFSPYARDTSFSNFFIYALVLVVLVFSNRDRFRRVHTPDILDLMAALLIAAGSFVFNYITSIYTGDAHFGLTDYVLLVIGIFAIFYSIRETIVRFGIAVLALLRGATLSLSVAYPWIFAGVSSFFVSAVLFLSRMIVSEDIYQGSDPGQIIVGGAANGSTVGIGWGCAGLEELIIVTALLYVLIDSFRLSLRRTIIWLAIGIAGSFIINIARMVILVWIAYTRGLADMLWVHTHLGDVLFLVWVAVFWVAFFRFSRLRESPRPSSAGSEDSDE